MRIGSLFSGAGGLDLAVEAVFSATTAWHCENDAAASKVLARRWPCTPNWRDITEVNWSSVPLVDILCGGYPCQPFSAAGRRKGSDDERHLWPYFAQAIRHLRPRYVVLENVAGHRTMGFDRVLADLAGIGYDTQWCSVRASDVGAPHRRERLFVLAHPEGARRGVRDTAHIRQADREIDASQDDCDAATDTDGGGFPTVRRSRLEREPRSAGIRSSIPAPHSQCLRCGSGIAEPSLTGGSPNRPHNGTGEGVAAHSPCDGRHEGRPEPARLIRGSDAAVSGAGPVELLPTPLARDGRPAAPGDYDRHTPSLAAVDFYLPTPAASDGTGGGAHPDSREGHSRQLIDYALLDGSPWGKYEPAIRRWETLTRPAPPPTEPNTKGNPRLHAAFSEWMMGWPAGWVTDIPGISRNDALRIIGNGVVPQQAIAALRWLLNVAEMVA